MFITRYEIYFTSIITFVLIIYKCFYLIFQCVLIQIIILFIDVFLNN